MPEQIDILPFPMTAHELEEKLHIICDAVGCWDWQIGYDPEFNRLFIKPRLTQTNERRIQMTPNIGKIIEHYNHAREKHRKSEEDKPDTGSADTLSSDTAYICSFDYTERRCAMSDKPKTIPDIIAEMRIGVNALQKYGAKPRKRDAWMVFLAMFADRIEAAYKRELGNAQKMRTALEQVVELAKAWASPGADAAVTLGLIIDRAQDSLSAPPRNCDVGTAEEQVSRHCKMCTIISRNGTRSCDYSKCNKCFATWAQMLYTKPEDASTEQEEGK